MHENRETSGAPAMSTGRSAKAHGRKADVNAEEESDCGVVPVSQPNKEAQVSAEVGEGRPWTEENIRRAHTPPTLSGERVPQGLSGVRQTARERKREKFTALLHHMNVALLRDSFYLLKKNAAPGVDGVRWQEYEDGLEDRLTDLHGRVHRGAYRAQPSRRVFIPKPDGRKRPDAGALRMLLLIAR
jgi:RNA-directed DNA polymerase